VNYGVATVSRIDKITGLFCRISSLLQGSFAKETYNFIDPTNQSHPILIAHKGKRLVIHRIDKIISLFCKRALQKRQYSAKETCDFIDPTDRIHKRKRLVVHMNES